MKSFAGFRVFLEKYEAKSKSDKEDARRRASDKGEPMGYVGGLQFQTNTKDSNVIRKVLATDPQIMSGIPWEDGDDELDTTYVPVLVNPDLHGGNIRTVSNVKTDLATSGGRRVDDPRRKGRIKKRKTVDDLLSVGWGPAVAAAAAGAAPGGAPGGAPPPM